jgi:hypothetical protein
MNMTQVYIYAEMGISEQIEKINSEMGEIEFCRALNRSTEEQEEKYKELSGWLVDWKKRLASLKVSAKENNIRLF